ncbi:MAG: HD domain-containing protein [Desulfosalsimonadaceae bacterium]
MNRPWGIRLKLTLITLALIAMTTFGSSMVVISIMDDYLLDSMIKRGSSVALSAATPAGFSILANDRLGLDNLVAKIKDSHPDVAYMTIVDRNKVILAHNRLSAVGKTLPDLQGPLVEKASAYKVKKGRRYGIFCYEVKAPIRFAENRVGSVIVGIKANALAAPKQEARNTIFFIAALAMAFGATGTLLLASFLTAPIKRLAAGFSQVKSGEKQVEIQHYSRDELGELTRSFNEMSKTIQAQKNSLENYAQNLENSYTAMVHILAAALDGRDKYTLGHSARVAWLSLQIGRNLGLEEEELKELEVSCFLHDIGKIKVPDVILTKETELNSKEYEIMKKHPIYGAEILSLSDSLHKYIPVVQQHHEWYNGQGYPYGLKGDEIHLHAQIVAIADSYDAMTSSRPYRRGRSKTAAAKEIQKFRGIQFAPHLVDIFIDTLNNIEKVEESPFAGAAL